MGGLHREYGTRRSKKRAKCASKKGASKKGTNVPWTNNTGLETYPGVLMCCENKSRFGGVCFVHSNI